MARNGKAVLCRELNKPVVVETIRVDPPKRGEVTVKIAACGVCHSDLSATNGTIALPIKTAGQMCNGADQMADRPNAQCKLSYRTNSSRSPLSG